MPSDAWFLRFSLESAALAALAATMLSLPSPAQAQGSCPNAEFRTGKSAHLPDCRAYEQVSPIDKNDGNVSFGPAAGSASPLMPTAVAPDGNQASYSSYISFADNPSAAVLNQYLSSRDASGWTTEGISPPKRALWTGVDTRTGYAAFSEDLSHMAVVNWVEPEQFSLLRRNPDGSFERVADAASRLFPPVFAGASPDFSHIVVTIPDGGSYVYLWTEGQPGLDLVSEIGGTLTHGGSGAATNGGGSWGRVISDDGSRVFWSGQGSGDGSHVYDTETQTQTDIPGFITASADGSTVLYGLGGDLFAFDTATTTQTNLTAAAAGGSGVAGFQGILGASENLSHIYFVAQGVLASGATAGEQNLYVLHDGTFAFIGNVVAADNAAWGANRNPLVHSTWTQVSADGRHLVFKSSAPTSQVVPGSSYDNAGHDEIYLYDAEADEVTCVSCNPTGVAATGDAALGQAFFGIANFATYRNVSADGNRVLFETTDALLPQDTNGRGDVYMWEEEGVGSCASETQNGGCLALISTGRSEQSSFYQGMSESGDDAFFITDERLVGQDDDDLMDLYDARVEGGLASQHPDPPPPPCSGDSCRPRVPMPPGSAAPGSAMFTAPGNPAANSTRCSRLERKVKRLSRKLRKGKRKLRRAEEGRKKRRARSKVKSAKRHLKGAMRQLQSCEGGAR